MALLININTFLYSHQSYSLPGADAFLVDENQDADDGADEAETPHQAGHDERRVDGHRHQLVAALAVVVPVFAHGTSERQERERIVFSSFFLL